MPQTINEHKNLGGYRLETAVKKHFATERFKPGYKEHEVECPEITKRTIGKAIVTFCGNEGTEDDTNKAGLRRLLQAVISETENKTRQVLKDAEIVVYDDQFQKYAIRAGDGKAKFLATFDEKGIPRVIRTYNLK